MTNYYPNISDPDFLTKIPSHYEFYENKLTSPLNYKLVLGELLPYQRTIARYLSPYTPYEGILLFHAMGSGKTCTAIGTIELWKKYFKRAIVLAPGETLLKNFQNELLFRCTKDVYIPENYDMLTDYEKTARTNKNTDYYVMNTFEKFGKLIESLNDFQIERDYSNSVIVLDEIHNLPDNEIYKEIWRFLHLVKDCKVLLLTGTPMRDTADEIKKVMNLILPRNEQLVSMDVASLRKAFIGRVSYLKQLEAVILKQYNGSTIGNLRNLKVYPVQMSTIQNQTYAREYAQDLQNRTIYLGSRQASLAIFPDGSSNIANSPRWYKIDKKKKQVSITADGAKYFKTIDDVAKYSAIYGNYMKKLLDMEKNGEKSFIFCFFVHGTGLLWFVSLLQHFGWQMATGRERTKGKRFVFLNNIISNIRELNRAIIQYNLPENQDGSIVRIIIGSELASHGFSLYDTPNVDVFTPNWNMAETIQAIARAYRTGSFENMIQCGRKPIFKITQYVSMPQEAQSIDLYMYEVSEGKQENIEQVENIIKECAFDCVLNKEQNGANIKCQEISNINYAAYNAYYSEQEIQRIRQALTIYIENSQVYSWSIVDLKNASSPISEHQLYNAIARIIISQQPFRYNLQLFEDGDLFFLQNGTRLYQIDQYMGDVARSAIDFDVVVEEIDNIELIFLNSNTIEQLQESWRNISGERQVKIFEIATKIIVARREAPKLPALLYVIWYFSMMFNSGALLSNSSKLITPYYVEPQFNFTDNKLVHWINSPTIRILSKQWENADETITSSTLATIDSAEQLVFSNPDGYYGIISKKNNSFCIRDIVGKFTKAKRKTVGKRCSNWTKLELETLVETIGHENFDLQATNDIWSQISARDLCSKIFSYFYDNNMILSDDSCGSHYRTAQKK